LRVEEGKDTPSSAYLQAFHPLIYKISIRSFVSLLSAHLLVSEFYEWTRIFLYFLNPKKHSRKFAKFDDQQNIRVHS